MSSRAELQRPLVSLNPTDTLVFKLGRNQETKAVLNVKNTSSSKIVFKVKTTQPTWYYVKPNQQVLDVGQSEEVVIVLIETEGNRLADFVGDDKPDKLDKHRFMVQTKVLTEEEFEKIKTIPVAQRSDEFAKVWNSGHNQDRKNLKLKVDFILPENANIPAPSAGSKERLPSVSENVEIIRNGLALSDKVGAKDAIDASSRPEDIHKELITLRKKYDAVVEYTVHLTAERDTIVSQLEEAQRELAREVGRKTKPDTPKGSISKSDKTTTEKKVAQGFPLVAIIITAILFYLLGRYLKF